VVLLLLSVLNSYGVIPMRHYLIIWWKY